VPLQVESAAGVAASSGHGASGSGAGASATLRSHRDALLGDMSPERDMFDGTPSPAWRPCAAAKQGNGKRSALAVVLSVALVCMVSASASADPRKELEETGGTEWLVPVDNALEPRQIVTFEGPEYSLHHLEWMREQTECTNLEEVLASVDFEDPEQTPYPSTFGYDTVIDRISSCYVVFESEESRLPGATGKARYRLENGMTEEMQRKNITTLGIGTVFKTHARACGACSTLEALSVYLGTPDLTNPVRNCAMRMMRSRAVSCLQDNVGLKGACGMIWYWNTKNTKKPRSSTGCLGTCLVRYFSSNNEPRGSLNPCSPAKCRNTINGEQACADFQWQNGPYRLNPCIQCDECKSGPIFQKVAGRTRRASGIQSAISRPPGQVSEVYHFYGRSGEQL